MIISSSVESSRKDASDFKYYTNTKSNEKGIEASVYNCVKCSKCGELCLTHNEPTYQTKIENNGENVFTFMENVSAYFKSAGMTKLKKVPGKSMLIDGKCYCETCSEEH